MTSLSITKLSWHLIWIFGLLEMITVPMVAWLPRVLPVQTKSPWQGAVVGFLGIVCLFFILNSALSRLKIKINEENVTKMTVLPAALWNTILLALIFGIQKITAVISIESWILRYLFAGFVSVFGAVLITLSLYTVISKHFNFLRITVMTDQHRYAIKKVSVFPAAFLAGAYEALALPLILLWQEAGSNVPLIAAITGLAGGVTGAGLVLFFYNHTNLVRFTLTMEMAVPRPSANSGSK